jgi:hypothetical protein
MLRRVLFGILAIFVLPLPSQACSIPVFRYALERWRPSPYEFLVYHRGPLTDADKKALKEVERTAADANIEITDVDLDGRVDSASKAIWEKHGGKNALPWVIVRFPDADLKMPPAWSGSLDAPRINSLIDSPLRQQMANGFFRGESASFILLESGDEKADAEAFKLMETELAKLQKKIQLPNPTREGPQLRSELPLLVSFQILRLSRKNEAEAGFVDLLLRCEDGIEKAKGPIMLAVFGRGRLLTALHGKDLKAVEIEQLALFLCGACSCQVKELNPGVDLLFRCRWETILEIELAPMPREPKR